MVQKQPVLVAEVELLEDPEDDSAEVPVCCGLFAAPCPQLLYCTCNRHALLGTSQA